MSDVYFNVKREDALEENGIVVSVHEGKLETFAGESSPSKFGCTLGLSGELSVKEGYRALPLRSEDAVRLREDYLRWQMFQSYVVADSSPESVLSNTLGTREFSQRKV
ncbi:MAG: hypothetical protein KKC19_03865 [Nanoarchaeota archaeon]|nr:hypothetical protein [Nanoarchaeota archaeon]